MTMNPATALEECETLMLDMDGTLLDLAYDNYMWMEHIPAVFAQENNISAEEAIARLRETFLRLQGTLDWYCLDHWADHLQLDVAALHRQQNDRIGFLPGAREFLENLAGHDLRVLMVTNSHQKTLDIKAEVTGITEFFDGIYTSHALGHAKEDQPFWHALHEAEEFDKETSLFIDDNVTVLQSARTFGIGKLLNITRPDTRHPPREHDEFYGIEGVAELII
ncbi:MAG: HAD superfamily hydrolase (TIGR01509 family) [Woeseiaceae bacterium]|jgi:HAD superfamily hydrolase (TIGR01509 family)